VLVWKDRKAMPQKSSVEKMLNLDLQQPADRVDSCYLAVVSLTRVISGQETIQMGANGDKR